MANYRVVTTDESGKPGRHRSFICDGDDDALVWAKHLVDNAPVELWMGARFVTRLEPEGTKMPKVGVGGPTSAIQ